MPLPSPRLAHFALLTAGLPFLCVHLSYLLAAWHGQVPWCVPYWDSCTSISATGRELPAKLVFKLIMMPAAMCAIAFWWLVRQWLRQRLGCDSRAVWALGTVAALFLMLYVAALGESNEYRWARQIGVILFFSLTYLAQLLYLYRAHHSTPVPAAAPGAGSHHGFSATEWRVLQRQLQLALLMLAIGIGSVVLDLIHPRYDDMEDAVEWILMLGLVLQFASHARLWHEAGLQLRVAAAAPLTRPARECR